MFLSVCLYLCVFDCVFMRRVCAFGNVMCSDVCLCVGYVYVFLSRFTRLSRQYKSVFLTLDANNVESTMNV